jgi:hypothetical protein
MSLPELCDVRLRAGEILPRPRPYSADLASQLGHHLDNPQMLGEFL